MITYDVRGHGRTGGSAAGTYSVELFAADLRVLVDALGLDRPVVCGLSLGGCIAQVHAAAHPDEVSGLVLADTFAPELRGRGEWVQRSLLLRATVPFVRVVGYERVERASCGYSSASTARGSAATTRKSRRCGFRERG